MDVQKIFEILEIPVTKEERQIHQAYRRLLVNVNPEDDQEGFIRLREAYENALAYANAPEEAEEGIRTTGWLQNSPVGAYMGRVMEVYQSLPRRIDRGEWEALIQDPVLDSLDDGEGAKWALFAYLAEHYRLPGEIWRTLDRGFFIEENQEEFREHLPEAFVDYVLNRIHMDGGFNLFYDQFRGAPDADYDGYMEILLRFLNDRDLDTPEGQEEVRRTLDKLDSFRIRHPWCEMERARYFYSIGQTVEAESLARRILKENPADERICLTGADLLMNLGFSKDAQEIYETYLKGKVSSYGAYEALYGLAFIEADRENWERARSLLLDAKRFRNTDAVTELLAEVSKELVRKYTAQAENLTEEEILRLGWCFFDSRQAQEGLAFFGAHPEYGLDTAEFHKVMALLCRDGGDGGVLREVHKWRALLEQEMEAATYEKNSREEHEDRWDLALGYHMEGGVLRRMTNEIREKEGNSPRALELQQQSMKAHDRALELSPEDTEFRLHRVLLLSDMRKYQEMLEDCRKILEQDDQNFWACFYLQEAYEGLGRAQDVVELFYRIREIYAGNPKIYLRAVDALTAYGKYEQALEILKLAEEAQVDGYHLLILNKMGVLNHLVKDEETYQEAVRFGEGAVRRLTEEETAAWVLAEACMKMAYLYEQNQEFGRNMEKEEKLQKAIDHAEHSLELYEMEKAHYFVGRFYIRYREDAGKAWEHLKFCEEQGATNDWLFYHLARCCEKNREWNQAIAYYKKAIDKNPEFPEGYWRLSMLYRGKLNRTEQREYADLALQYAALHEEKIRKTNEIYRWRAYVYLRTREYEKALEQIDQGVKVEGDSGMWFLRGQILREMRRYEEAIESFEHSIRAEDRFSADDEESFRKIFQCFLSLGRLEEGIRYFENALEQELEPSVREKCMENLSDLEGASGRHDWALMWQEKRYGSLDFSGRSCDTWKREANRVEDVLDVWLKFCSELDEEFRKKLQEAAALAEAACEDENGELSGRALMCHNVGEALFYAGEPERAFDFLEMALSLADRAEKYGSRRSLYRDLAQVGHFLGRSDKAKEYGDQYRALLEKDYEECEDLGLPLEELMTRPRRGAKRELYRLFCWAFYTGRADQARAYAAQMEKTDMCYWCDEEGCTELWEIKGYLAWADGRMEESLAAFQRAEQLCWLGLNKDAALMIRTLTRKLCKKD